MPRHLKRTVVKTPLRFQDQYPASRPRSQPLLSQAPTNNGDPGSSNVPAPAVQSPLRGGDMEAGPSASPAPALTIEPGSPTRFYFPTTWWNFSSTMKLVLVHQVGEEIGNETVEAQNKAMEYLEMNDDEKHDLCDLDDHEYARAIQYEDDTAAYDEYLFSIPSTATTLSSVQSQRLAELEKKQMDNMKAGALAGPLVKQEDVKYAQRFIQERAPTDTPLRRAILRSLERHVGQNYVKNPISSFLRPPPDSDDE